MEIILLNIHSLMVFIINMIKFTAIFYKPFPSINFKLMSSSLQLSHRETTFHQEVVTRFELYNSLFSNTAVLPGEGYRHLAAFF